MKVRPKPPCLTGERPLNSDNNYFTVVVITLLSLRRLIWCVNLRDWAGQLRGKISIRVTGESFGILRGDSWNRPDCADV